MNKNSQRSRRWRDTDGKGTCRTIRMWRNTLSKNASPMVLSEGQGVQRLSDCPRSVCVMSSRADEASLSTNISVHTRGRNKIRSLPESNLIRWVGARAEITC
jgi:hypothetical protein